MTDDQVKERFFAVIGPIISKKIDEGKAEIDVSGIATGFMDMASLAKKDNEAILAIAFTLASDVLKALVTAKALKSAVVINGTDIGLKTELRIGTGKSPLEA